MFALNTLAIGAASLFAIVAADHGHVHARAHHHDIAERSEHHLQKRFNGRATYYQTGLGACGQYNNPGDKIVALNSAQYGGGYPGPNCFKMITICKGSVCHGAQIVDECPTCPYGGLDMSQSLFEQFASTDAGVFEMTWTFSDGGNPPEPTSQKPDPPKTTKKPEPTTEWQPEPTPTPEPPKTTTKKRTTTSSPPPETTSTPEPTTSTSTSTSTSSSTSSTPSTTSTSVQETTSSTSVYASASAAPSGTPAIGNGNNAGTGSNGGSNLQGMSQALLGMGRLAVTGFGA